MTSTKQFLKYTGIAYGSTVATFGISFGLTFGSNGNDVYNRGVRARVKNAACGVLFGATFPVWGPVWLWRGCPQNFDWGNKFLQVSIATKRADNAVKLIIPTKVD
jgi:hypothetical protein